MRIVTSPDDLRRALCSTQESGIRVGLVPTMGALHAGHLALIHHARSVAEKIVVSIYVNPTQFGPAEDFSVYPRMLSEDLALCEEAGVDLVFAPENLYCASHSVVVEETRISGMLCGRSRPGHFSGVLTVVTKLLNLVQPDVAVFGEKDAQQLALIRQLVADLDVPVEIDGVQTIREDDGLALSSRNRYLSTAERIRAASIFRALSAAKRDFKDGEDSVERVCENLRGRLVLEAGDDVDYIECVDDRTWTQADHVTEHTRLCVAVRIGKTRLIDNIVLGN